jgi:16S rRNA (guanine1207-N2)-methyltransferase
MSRRKKEAPSPAELLAVLGERLRPPFCVVLGAPGEASRIVAALASPDVVAYQMDLYPAERLREALAEHALSARVETAADLWDLPADFQTVIYPAPKGGERELKIDMVEQAFHVLRPGGVLVVLSPYEKDNFFPALLKKVFGRVHAPTAGGTPVFWCRREGERPRRRHEVTFPARVGDSPTLHFLSRPGTFAYGRFDDGARALVSLMEVHPGDRVVDVGCGCGTNGVFAARRSGPRGHTTFIDSNLRAAALAEHNARANGVEPFEVVGSSRVEGPAEGTFDVALANPPYLAQSAVAGLFAVRSRALLRPGGRFYLVTRQPHEVAEIVTDVFGEAEAVVRGGYTVFRATVAPPARPRGAARR